MKYLIFGLGNIGQEYANTRHNIGFIILDAFAKASNLVFEPNRYGATVKTRIKGRQIILIKPSTLMNLSGKAVRYWMQKEKVEAENILVIADDINLPFGKIRIRPKGGDGGHNGLKNIIELIGSSKFPRLRYGIGKEFGTGKQSNFVLGELSKEEEENIEKNTKKTTDIIKSFAINGLERTMNLHN